MNLSTRLFTPGPLNTSVKVRDAMNVDIGSRTPILIDLTKKIRVGLQEIADCSNEYTTILLQGSGTFAIEAMLSSLVQKDDFVLVISNGVYGDRLVEICQIHNINYCILKQDSTLPINLIEVSGILKDRVEITHIVAVQFETAIGVLNDVNSLLKLANEHGIEVMIDAMSSFGALPLDYNNPSLTAVVSSANKCLHSVPGVGFILVRLQKLINTIQQKTLSLDLKSQYQEFEKTGQWRFTPPTHALLALGTAIDEFKESGGMKSRFQRYSTWNKQLIDGFADINIYPVIRDEYRAPMITTFIINDENLNFNDLYLELYHKGLIIYPSSFVAGKSFRVGCIGNINSKDIQKLIDTIKYIVKNNEKND